MPYAFAVPIQPGKTDALQRLIAESLGPRKIDYDDVQRRSGVTGEAYWLQSDPDHGDTLIVVSDGEACERDRSPLPCRLSSSTGSTSTTLLLRRLTR